MEIFVENNTSLLNKLNRKYSRLKNSYVALKSKCCARQLELQSVNNEMKMMKNEVSCNYVTRNEYDHIVKQRNKLKYLCEKESYNSSDDDGEKVPCISVNDLKYKYTLLLRKYNKLKTEKLDVLMLEIELAEAVEENDRIKKKTQAYKNLKDEYANLIEKNNETIKKFYQLQEKSVKLDTEVNTLAFVKSDYIKLKATYIKVNEKYASLKDQFAETQNLPSKSAHNVDKTVMQEIEKETKIEETSQNGKK
ncbi:hypothetical protein FQA39_LY00286 [Lamprigera yunnana]|nr:hypothetical protein FQA39_LY00286 [Lamprigera yunnana]